jgi:hypothetical protein
LQYSRPFLQYLTRRGQPNAEPFCRANKIPRVERHDCPVVRIECSFQYHFIIRVVNAANASITVIVSAAVKS